MTKVYEFGGGRVREHLGGIYDFLQRKELESLDELQTARLSQSPAPAPSAPAAGNPKEASAGKQSYEERKEQARQRKKAERLAEQCEAEVVRLEEEKAALEARLATPEGAADAALFEQYGQLQQKISEAEAAWEAAMEDMQL